jgi:hypothetical protein
MFALAEDGKTNKKGMPNPLRLAVIARAHFDTVRAAATAGVAIACGPGARGADGAAVRLLPGGLCPAGGHPGAAGGLGMKRRLYFILVVIGPGSDGTHKGPNRALF